jgi:CO/xanthine dehydrogenase Mo-binding subunit
VRFARQQGRDGIAFNGLDAAYYDIPNRLGEAVPQETGLRTSSLRGIAHLTNIFAIESFIDELARRTIRDGAVEKSNFYDYRVPRMNAIPEIFVEVVSTNNHPTGVGQMATPLIAPAIANAALRA